MNNERYEGKKTIDEGISAAVVVFFATAWADCCDQEPHAIAWIVHACKHACTHIANTSHGILSEHIVWFYCFYCGTRSPLESYGSLVVMCASMSTEKNLKTNENIINWLVGLLDDGLADWPASSWIVSVPIWLKCSSHDHCEFNEKNEPNNKNEAYSIERKDCMVSPPDCEVTSDNE